VSQLRLVHLDPARHGFTGAKIMNITKSAFHKHKAHSELSVLLNKTHGLPLPLLFPASPNNVKTWDSILDSLRQFKQSLPPKMEVALSRMLKLWINDARRALDILIIDDEVDDKASVPSQPSKYSRQQSARTRYPQSERAYHGHF
jgi:hypothetical protein